ncbi:Hemopexin/matrixin [Penicillium taxi]|uniref:Hemopexin/matrixin n=1 Tax=Penicillium taxi TaxID=168475 RepID=UPI002545355B|nr:Hemopexin/matrixin [Penicillium taxi]KAJ5894359.1 Hemopexin/matrixin [Penicillium taxi]
MVNAVIPKPGHDRQFYVFSGRRYIIMEFEATGSRTDDKLIQLPRWNREWNTFKEADWGIIDVVILVPGYTDQFYVFNGGHYFRGKILNDGIFTDSMLYGGVKTLASQWTALVDAGFDTVDAAIVDPNHNDYIFFFRGTKSLKYSLSENKVLAGPKPISTYWRGIGKADFDSIDAIFKSPNPGDSYYVFKGDKYARIKWDGGWDSLEYGPISITAWNCAETWL